jgi:hypothetical protein
MIIIHSSKTYSVQKSEFGKISYSTESSIIDAELAFETELSREIIYHFDGLLAMPWFSNVDGPSIIVIGSNKSIQVGSNIF